MTHRFPPLAPQDPIHQRAAARARTRVLPHIGLPWLEVGLTVALFLALHFG